MLSPFLVGEKYLTRDGSIFFYYDDHFQVLKDIKSYMEDYNVKIDPKFVVLNNMHNTNPEFPNKKVIFFQTLTRLLMFMWAPY